MKLKSRTDRQSWAWNTCKMASLLAGLSLLKIYLVVYQPNVLRTASDISRIQFLTR